MTQALQAECALHAALIAAGTVLVIVIARVRLAAARHAARSGVVLAMLFLAAVDCVGTEGVAASVRAAWDWTGAIQLLGAGVLLARMTIGTRRAHALLRRAVHHGEVLASAPGPPRRDKLAANW